MYNVLTPLSILTLFFAGLGPATSPNSPTTRVGRALCPLPRSAEASFLGLARAINASLPDMDGPLLTAFVDRWRPETHTFHLPSGEMSMLMQDIGYILGLRLDGPTVTGTVEPLNWKDMVDQFTGHQPPDPKEGKKEKKTSGVSSACERS